MFLPQRSTVDRLTNTQILMLFIILVVLCLGSAIFNEIWTRKRYKTDWYLGIDGKWELISLPSHIIDIITSFRRRIEQEFRVQFADIRNSL